MKYKQNLRVDGDKVFSYNTHVATIVLNKLVKLGWWSLTTSKHINYIASLYGLEVIEQEGIQMENKIKFATLNEKGEETNIRFLNQSDIAKCTHYIFATAHYNTNGTCKCNEANNKDMKKWGYKWNGSEWK